jgi:5-methylcytosine-specific restriction endonuclease McrA
MMSRLSGKDWYKSYIERFYADDQFNRVYKRYLKNTKDKYLVPSIDHIVPKTKGGTDDVNNLQVLSWFENRAKNNMTQAEWDRVKQNMKEYLI